MSISESNIRLRKIINKAIEDHIITPEEYDEIINVSLEDGFIDTQERALLKVLQEMIPYFSQNFGNASSIHFFGQEALQAVEKARLPEG